MPNKDDKEPRDSHISSNSHKSKEEHKIVPVADGKIAKKSLEEKFKKAFLGDEAMNVKSYLIWDVLVPALKDTLADLVKKGIDAILYGKSKAPENINRDRGNSFVSYNSMSRSRYETRNDPPWRTSRDYSSGVYRRSVYDFADVEYDTREQAERVLSGMADILDQGMAVSVADFYELSSSRIRPSWTDNGYGWYDISGARVSRNHRGMWYIELSRPVPITD